MDKVKKHEDYELKNGIKNTIIEKAKYLGIHRNTYGKILKEIKENAT